MQTTQKIPQERMDITNGCYAASVRIGQRLQIKKINRRLKEIEKNFSRGVEGSEASALKKEQEKLLSEKKQLEESAKRVDETIKKMQETANVRTSKE